MIRKASHGGLDNLFIVFAYGLLFRQSDREVNAKQKEKFGSEQCDQSGRNFAIWILKI
jgi:hypothetical protein